MINWIGVREQLLDLELASLESYLIELDDFMLEKQLRVKEDFAELKTVKLENEEYAQVLEESYIEDYQVFSKRYPNKLRLALLLETYTVLEKYVTEVCIFLKDSLLLEEELPEENKRSLTNLKSYLKRNCSINFNKLNIEWEFICKIRLIRNLIAHGHGFFEVEVNDEGKITKGEKISTFILNHLNITVVEKEQDLRKIKEGKTKQSFCEIYNIYLPSIKLNIELIETIRSFAQKISSTIFIAKEGRVR